MHCLQLLSIPALPQPINLAAAPRQLLENHKNHLVGTSTLEPKCWKTWSHFPWINFKTERTKTEYAGLCCQQRWRQRASTHPKAKDPPNVASEVVVVGWLGEGETDRRNRHILPTFQGKYWCHCVMTYALDLPSKSSVEPGWTFHQ